MCVNTAIEKLINEIFDKVELDYDSVSENWVLSIVGNQQIKKKNDTDDKSCC